VNLTGRFNYRFGVTQLILAAESAAGLYTVAFCRRCCHRQGHAFSLFGGGAHTGTCCSTKEQRPNNNNIT